MQGSCVRGGGGGGMGGGEAVCDGKRAQEGGLVQSKTRTSHEEQERRMRAHITFCTSGNLVAS